MWVIAQPPSPRRCDKVCSTSSRPRFGLRHRRRLCDQQHRLAERLSFCQQVASLAFHLIRVAGADAGSRQLSPFENQWIDSRGVVRTVCNRVHQIGPRTGARSSHRFGHRVTNRPNVLAVGRQHRHPMAVRHIAARASRGHVADLLDDEHHRQSPRHRNLGRHLEFDGVCLTIPNGKQVTSPSPASCCV